MHCISGEDTAAYTLWHSLIIAALRGLFETARLSCCSSCLQSVILWIFRCG